MLYRKLKRTWSHGYANYMPKLKEEFPELSKYSNEELCDKFINLNMDFYYEENTSVHWLVRLTIPFALVVYVLMVIGLPIYFIATGKWGYSLGDKNRILNWMRALKLQ